MVIGQKNIFIGARIIWFLALLLLLVVLAGGPGVHLGLWSPLEGFMLSLKGGFLGGLGLVGLSVIIMITIAVKKKTGGTGKAFQALLIGLLLAAPVGYLRLSGGGGVPPIHDITTDMVNPPIFITLVGKRGEEPNSLEYEGAELAAQQKAFYPDIVPLMVPEATQDAFSRALRVAGKLGWEITGVDARALRFEATDYSSWFNFADDIVVIITETEKGSQIDLRSVSRVGRSDLGVNAKRIMAFQKAFPTSS